MAITFNDWVNLNFIYYYNGSSYSSNYASSTAFDYFSDGASVGSALYFGMRFDENPPKSEKFRNLKFYVGTTASYTDAIFEWQYWDGSSWVPIAVTDNTNDFQNSGENTVVFTPPNDWREKTINGQKAHWLRKIFLSGTITEGGAQSTQVVKAGSNTIQATGTVDMDDIYNADVSGSWGVVEKIGDNSYYVSGADILFGDGGTTSTTVDLSDNHIYVENNWRFWMYKRINLTLNHTAVRMRVDHGDCWGWTYSGVFDARKMQWYIDGGSATDSMIDFYVGYACSFQIRSNITWDKCLFIDRGTGGGTSGYIIDDHYGTPTYNDCIFHLGGNLDIASSLSNNRCKFKVKTLRGFVADPTFNKPEFLEITYLKSYYSNITINNPVFVDDTYTVVAHPNDRWIKIYYDLNIHVQNNNGGDVAGASVVIKDKDGNQVFSGTTDLNALDVNIKKEFTSDAPFILVSKSEEAGGSSAYVV